jgi:hypothetical protein
MTAALIRGMKDRKKGRKKGNETDDGRICHKTKEDNGDVYGRSLHDQAQIRVASYS